MIYIIIIIYNDVRHVKMSQEKESIVPIIKRVQGGDMTTQEHTTKAVPPMRGLGQTLQITVW